MSTTWDTNIFSPAVSVRTTTIIVGLTLVVAVGEAFVYFGNLWYTLWTYTLLLVGLSLSPLVMEEESTVFQAFALIPVFRLVNLGMPVFIELTVFWLPLVYAPFIPVVIYLGRLRAGREAPESGAGSSPAAIGIGHELPWWLGGDRSGKVRRALRGAWQSLSAPPGVSRARAWIHSIAKGLFVVLVPVLAVAFLVAMGVLTVYLAEIEYGIITPTPLVPSLDPVSIGLLAVTMIVFVGFVEELLFRGVLQQVLERRLGVVPGLLLASGIFAVMHSGAGLIMAIVFAGAAGLLFGLLYDATDSLVLVSVMHGLLNVLVFGVIPLDGGSSIDLLYAVAVRELQRFGIWWLVEPLLGVGGIPGLL